MKRPLRAITYLSPGIPLGFFEHLTELLARSVGRPVEIQTEGRISGPMQGDHDPFAAGEVDIGFLCAPSYLYLVAQPAPSVELLPAAFVFRDPRNAGRPVLFSDVIVRADSAAQRLDDLRGSRFGFNDRCSLSGYYSLRQELRARGLADRFFGEERCTGSHHSSIEAVREGSVDVAAIDSNVLLLESRRRPELSDQLRILESWGPFPIQPIVVGAHLPAAERAGLASALLELTRDPEADGVLGWMGFERFVRIGPDHYEGERRALQELGSLPCSGAADQPGPTG